MNPDNPNFRSPESWSEHYDRLKLERDSLALELKHALMGADAEAREVDGLIVELNTLKAEYKELEENLQRALVRAEKAEHYGSRLAQEVKKILPKAPKMNGREDFSQAQHIVARALDQFYERGE